MRQQIEITFDGEGQPTIHVTGVPGPGCRDLTAALEKALGTVVESTNTREHLQRPTAQQQRAGQ